MLPVPTLPSSLMALLVVFESCFTAPSFRTFCGLAAGLVAQTGPRTVCGMLTGGGVVPGVGARSGAPVLLPHPLVTRAAGAGAGPAGGGAACLPRCADHGGDRRYPCSAAAGGGSGRCRGSTTARPPGRTK